MEIPKPGIVKYEVALKADQLLVIVHGTAEDVAKASDIIKTIPSSGLGIHAGEAPEPVTV